MSPDAIKTIGALLFEIKKESKASYIVKKSNVDLHSRSRVELRLSKSGVEIEQKCNEICNSLYKDLPDWYLMKCHGELSQELTLIRTGAKTGSRHRVSPKICTTFCVVCNNIYVNKLF